MGLKSANQNSAKHISAMVISRLTPLRSLSTVYAATIRHSDRTSVSWSTYASPSPAFTASITVPTYVMGFQPPSSFTPANTARKHNVIQPDSFDTLMSPSTAAASRV